MMRDIPATLETAAARCGCHHDDLQRFADQLAVLPPLEAARINAFHFAEAAGVQPDTAIDLFVHGAKLGLFDLEWGMVCPMCGAITQSVAHIDRVAENTVHCSICQRDAASVLDDTVEVSFAYNPASATLNPHRDFATYHHYYTSTSFASRDLWRGFHETQTVADARIEPGAVGTLAFRADPGQIYRLLCLDTHAGGDLTVVDGGGSESAQEIALSDRGFSPAACDLAAGDAKLTVANRTDQPVWCRVLQVDVQAAMAIIHKHPPEFGRRLTGKHLLNNQAFRDCFDLHELAPDLKLKLRSLTLLFTDLKGSTALYDREGDLAAYRLVQDHFAALKQVVRGHSGAIIKTMGDAIMAAFPQGGEGIRAAISMMRAMGELTHDRHGDEVGLKVGLHAGPALAINAGSSLDYFGQTVNIAARVQGLADAGDICVTRSLNDDEVVPGLLADAGYSGQAETAHLKGVSAAEQVYRYRRV